MSMLTRSGPLLVGIGIASALMIEPALSQDQTVTIRVPVQLKKMYPDLENISVGCELLNASQQPIQLDALPTPWAYAFAPVADGAFDGIVEVSIDLTNEQFAAAKTYTCRLHVFFGQYPTDLVKSASAAGPDPMPAAKYQARPDEFFLTEITGQLSGIPVPAGGLQLAPPN